MEVLGIGESSEEDPVPEEPPPNLVLYMHRRICAYSSNVRMASFDGLYGLYQGLYARLRDLEEFEVFPKIFFIKGTGSRYEADLLYPPALA